MRLTSWRMGKGLGDISASRGGERTRERVPLSQTPDTGVPTQNRRHNAGPLSFPIRGRPIDARNQALHVRTTFGPRVRTFGLSGSVGCPDFRCRPQKVAKYGHLAPDLLGASTSSGRLAPVGSFSRPWCPDFHPAQTPFLTLHVRTFGHPDGQNR